MTKGSQNKSAKGRRSTTKRANKREGGRQIVSPFPPLRMARLRYTDTFTLIESSVGVGAYTSFTPSSLYDPNITGTGHQPMFFDQLCTSTGPYTKYRALSTKARITISNLGTGPVYGGWYIQQGPAAPASLQTCMEKPWSKWTLMSGIAGSKCVVSFDVTIPHHRALGITATHMKTDDYYAGEYNASPLRVFNFVVWVNAQVSSVASTVVTVELDTSAEFFGLTNTGTS